MARVDGIEDQVRAVIYGNCIGDALGLLTEFMTKKTAKQFYCKDKKLKLNYSDKVDDFHRSRWQVGDWTDDSDQMILIMMSVTENHGKVVPQDFAHKLFDWRREGIPELGDIGGMGIGKTTSRTLSHSLFLSHPHKAAEEIWISMAKAAAPNGGVMRTSVLGCLQYSDIPTVTRNTIDICKVTHADPRCQASCVIVTTAISLMLQKKHFNPSKREYDVESILEEAYQNAVNSIFKDLPDCTEKAEELRKFVFEDSRKLTNLKLDDDKAIGYTYKCLGAGCWAFRQKNFETAMQDLVMEAGDADTNGAVAGALLGCKLGCGALRVKRGTSDWLEGLKYKSWLDDKIIGFLKYLEVQNDVSNSHSGQRVWSELEQSVMNKESNL